MRHDTEIVREYYNSSVESEWIRLDRHPYEFELNRRFLSRYIKPGDRVLDAGGGPGRYSLWLAERGCDVTLLDLSDENVKFALEKAAALGLNITAAAGDARYADTLVSGKFDHVLLMGPLYHLTEEADRIKAVESCLKVLKSGGTISAAFISIYGGLIYDLRDALTELETLEGEDREFYEKMIHTDLDIYKDGKSLGYDGFTRAFFTFPADVPRFFERFPLEKLHFYGIEGFIAPFSHNVDNAPEHIRKHIVDIAEHTCEREEILSYSEHLMYIGQKM